VLVCVLLGWVTWQMNWWMARIPVLVLEVALRYASSFLSFHARSFGLHTPAYLWRNPSEVCLTVT